MRSISAEGRGEQSVITQGGARDGLLLRREGWEVDVIVNTTGLIGFSYFTLCLYNKIRHFVEKSSVILCVWLKFGIKNFLKSKLHC